MSTSHSVWADDGTALAAWADGFESSVDRSDAPLTYVLAHGWTLDHTSWDRVAVGLLATTPGARVVRWDQRGHGSSAAGPRRPTIKRLGDDLATVIRQLAPEGDLVLAGHSMGGMTILACAGRYPELVAGRVKGVGLVSTAGALHAADGLDLSRGLGLPKRFRPAASLALPWVMRGLAALPGRAPVPGQRVTGTRALLFGDSPDPSDIAHTHAVIAANPASTLGRFYVALRRHDELAVLAHLGDIPTSIMVGTHDRLTPQHFSHALAERLPHASLHVLEGAGHMLTLERTEQVVSRLLTLTGAGDHARSSEGVLR